MSKYFYAQRLRALRRAYRLSHRELARLLGLRSADHVARLEKGIRQPSRDVLLKLRLIFDQPDECLVPKIVEEVVGALWQSTHNLRHLVIGKPDAKSQRKVELLDTILSRLALKQHENGGDRHL